MPDDKDDQIKRWWSQPKDWDKLKPLARENRKALTFAENLLWQRLRRDQVCGFRFRRQHVIGRYIVDFFCHQAKLIIEVDGPIHLSQQEADQFRQEMLEAYGFIVVRFTNNQVENGLGEVITEIESKLKR